MVALALGCTILCAILPNKCAFRTITTLLEIRPESLIFTPDNPLSISLITGTTFAVHKVMERDPQTDYEFQLWTHAHKLTGIVSSLLDALKTGCGLLEDAKDALPQDSDLDHALERFKRVIAAGERATKGLGIDLSE